MAARTAAEIASTYLEENADRLVEYWIDWVRERVNTETVQGLPERALRNHIPPVLKSLARYLAAPIELARGELLQSLKLHGQIRRDQGYSLAEVLAEFDGLSNVVTEAVISALSRADCEDSPAEILETASRLSTGLRSISYIAMGTYSQSDQERSHQIATNLEDLSRAISHEMKNPINTLSLGMQILREEVDEKHVEPYIAAMEAALKRCEYLVDTLRILTVAENARAGDNMVLLPDALRRIEHEFRQSAAAAGVDIRLADSLPELRVESVLLYIILANLLSNSLKYRDSSKEDCYVNIDASYIEEEYDSGFCELVVEDNGVGIPEEFLPRVLQKGFRAHPELAQGTGLGLYLVGQTVASRGGTVDVQSTEGGGTIVTVRMRCLQAGASDISADQFRVEHLMGETIWNEVTDHIDGGSGSRLKLPKDFDTRRTEN